MLTLAKQRLERLYLKWYKLYMITYAYLGEAALGEVIFEVVQVVHDNLCLPWPNSAWRGYI